MNIKTKIKRLISLLFPKHCPYCGKAVGENEYVCAECIADFPENFFTGTIAGKYPCVSSFLYEGKYRIGFLRFKFHNKKHYGASFAVSIANDICRAYNNIKFDYITCVPLSKDGLKQRRYNQSEVLALEISKILNIEYAPLLIKIKENKEQHRLRRSERFQNVQGVYALHKDAEVKGKTVLLCDDMLTTGFTLDACCKILDKAGVHMIYCATLLRGIDSEGRS